MRFGRTHGVLTTATGLFGILALAGAVPLPGVSSLQIVVESLIGAQVVAMFLRRRAHASSSDPFIFVLALVHMLLATFLGGGVAFVVAFVGLAVTVPAALVVSHLRREVEVNYQQGARDRTGSPVDVPRIMRSKRVIDGGTLAGLAALALPILVVTGIVFIASPRFVLGSRAPWLAGLSSGDRSGLVRLTDSVDLSQRGELHRDDAVALRFRIADLPPRASGSRWTLRFRGAELDTFARSGWSRSEAAGPVTVPPMLQREASTAGTRAVTIEREPFEPSLMLLPIGTRGGIRIDDARTYVAFVATDGSGADSQPLAEARRARLLELPPLPARIGGLARQWTASATSPFAKARAIEERLARGDFGYSLASSSRGQAEPLDHFLFESKRGHCELFASTMAVMLRQQGIPSRVITGLSGGVYNSVGDYFVVRQGDAHAWVEAYIEEPGQAHGGWHTFDPTPTSVVAPPTAGALGAIADLSDVVARRWGSDVVAYDDQSRGAIVGVLRKPTSLVLLAIVATCFIAWRSSFVTRKAGGVLRRIADRTPPDTLDAAAVDRNTATALYGLLEEALAAHGIVRDAALPPLAHAEHLLTTQHPLAEDVAAVTRIYLEARFGGRRLTEDVERELRTGVAKVLRWKRDSHSAA